MKQEELQQVRPGFEQPTLGSQAVFRRALQALSMPGRAVTLPALAQLPTRGHGAAAMLMLALLDSDCSLWLSPTLAGSDAEAWLRFHTGCRCVQDPAQARFLWLAAGDTWLALSSMHAGSDTYPDQSATCVMEVGALAPHGAEGVAWTLQGPGIQGSVALAVQGLPHDFAAQWAANNAMFPRGVDVFLATHDQIAGLPRTTRLCQPEPAEA